MIVNENTVFLRPQPSAAPVDYIREQAKSGMVMMASRNLAIYTCKEGANQGPQGPQGEPGADQNSWFDCVIAAVTDNESPISVSKLRETWRAPYPLDLTLGYIRCSLIEAPEGADFIVDVHMNGTTLFSTQIHVDDGSRTSVGSSTPSVLSVLYVPDDAEFEVYVTQVGTIATGVGLKVSITGIKAP